MREGGIISMLVGAGPWPAAATFGCPLLLQPDMGGLRARRSLGGCPPNSKLQRFCSAAVHVDHRALQKPALRPHHERDESSDILRLTEPPERRLCDIIGDDSLGRNAA